MPDSDPPRPPRNPFSNFPPGSYGDHTGGHGPEGPGFPGSGDDSDDGLPEWAAFFRTPERLARFYAVVSDDLQTRGLAHRLSDGVVTIRHKGGHEQQCGLLNLMQQCAAAEDRLWPELIRNHFGIMERTQEDSDRVESALRSFETVRKRLVVRLWDRDHLTQTKLSPVAREDIPGLLSTLAIDLPEAIRSLTPAEIAPWGKSEDELFELARKNILASIEPEVMEQDLGDAGADGRILLVQAESYYVASLALFIDRLPELLGVHGTFVSVPVRHMMLAVPLNEVADVQSLNALLAVTAGVFRDGPGSISPRAFWFDLETWHEIPYELTDEGLSVTPPEALVARLNTLAEDEVEESPEEDDDSADEDELEHPDGPDSARG